MFTPTLDWGNELWTSLVWIARGLGDRGGVHPGSPRADLPVHHVGQAILAHHRRVLQGPESIKVWLWLAALLLSVIAACDISVLLSFQGNDMMTSFQVIAGAGGNGDERERLWHTRLLGIFGHFLDLGRGVHGTHPARHVHGATVHAGVALWLTDRLTGDWLDGKAYYRARFIDDTIDNPDQRIHPDIDIFTAGMAALPTTFRITGRPTSCCSARLTRPHRWFPSPRSCGTCRARLTRARRQGRNSAGDVLGRAGLCPLCVRHRVLDR